MQLASVNANCFLFLQIRSLSTRSVPGKTTCCSDGRRWTPGPRAAHPSWTGRPRAGARTAPKGAFLQPHRSPVCCEFYVLNPPCDFPNVARLVLPGQASCLRNGHNPQVTEPVRVSHLLNKEWEFIYVGCHRGQSHPYVSWLDSCTREDGRRPVGKVLVTYLRLFSKE